MSELIAEARVLVQPDTTGFRAALIAQTTAAAKGVVVPVTVTPVVSGVGSLTAQKAALQDVEKQAVRGANASKQLAADELKAAKAAEEHARQLSGVGRGAGSAALSLIGLRGATLASTAPFLAGAAAAVTFAKAVGLAADFQKQLAILQATSGATASELEGVSAAAKELGADVTLPAVSATDAAEAMTELAKAGLSVQDSIAGARGVLQLATAAGIDNAQATELAASALNAFGLAGDQAVRVADTLANSSNDAQGSITDIGIALQQASAAGRQAGLSLEETVGILTEFARAGLKGSDAGTSLRTMLLRLINPTDKAQKVISDLGLHLRDATGNINLGFFDEFARKTQNLTKAERDRDAAIIAGNDAFRGLTILARTGGAALDAQITSLERSGTAADLAAARTSGLAGSIENLKNQLATAGLALGETLTPSVKGFVDILAIATEKTTTFAGEISRLREEAGQPINIVANIIPSGPGGGGQAGTDFAANAAKTLLTGSIFKIVGLGFEQISELEKEATRETAAFNAEVAKIKLKELVSDLNKAGATAPEFDKVVRKLQEMAKGLQGGSAETEAFRKSFEAFIAQLQNLSTQDITVPIKIPQGVLDGTFGTKAAQTTKTAFASELNKGDFGFGGFIQSLTNQGLQGFAAAGAAAGTTTGESFKAALAASLSNLDLAVAQAGGNQGQELDVLRERETRQDDFLQGLLKRPQTEKNVKLATQAAKNLEATRNAIKSILDQQASTAKQTAADVKAKASAADQAVLGALADARTQQENAVAKAAQTQGAADDIRETAKLRALITQQIANLRASSLDEKTRNAAILALQTARIQTVTSLQNLRDTDEQAREAQKQEAFSAQLSLAQATGDTSEQIRLINVRIVQINALINAHKAEGAALNKLKTERATLQSQREDLQNQRIQDQIALGQSIEDLTGNKNPLVNALNKAIAETRADIAAAQKAGKQTVVLRTELNNFLAQRKELLKQAKDAADEAKGLTAFDILQQNADTFRATGGNLINGQQPFAGPTGFTADVAQFLHRAPTVQTEKADFAAPLVSSNAELIRVIQENTDAIRQSTNTGNTATGGMVGVGGAAWTQATSFYTARRARQLVEAESP